MSFAQFFIVLRARYRIAVAVFAAVVAMTLVVSLVMPKRYTADTQLFFDLLSQDLIGGAGASLSANSSSSYVPTQIEIMTSSNVAQKVVERLHLAQDPAQHAAWLRATNGEGSELVWLARELRKGLGVRPEMDSNIVTLTFRSPNAAYSAAVANAFTAAYIETNLALHNGPANETSQWLEGRVQAARDLLQQAQAKVVDYQRAHGIVTGDERIDSETERLTLMSQQLVALQGQNADTQSKLQAGGANLAFPGVVQDGVASKLRGDIAELEAKLSVTAATFGPRYPTYLEMQAQLATLRSQLAAETRRTSGAISADSSAGKLRESRLNGTIAAQKQRMVVNAEQRAQLESLVKDRDAAQNALQDVSQKYIQASLLAHSVQTNVSVLAPASVPVFPSSPKPLLYALIAVMVGALLGIAAAFGCELADRRVRSDSDIADLLGVPVLGARRDLIRFSWLRRALVWSNA